MIEAIQFASFSEFIDMGGYGFNVWSVYFLFAIFVFMNLFSPLRKRKRIMRDLERRVLLSQRDSVSEATRDSKERVESDEANALSNSGTVGEPS